MELQRILVFRACYRSNEVIGTFILYPGTDYQRRLVFGATPYEHSFFFRMTACQATYTATLTSEGAVSVHGSKDPAVVFLHDAGLYSFEEFSLEAFRPSTFFGEPRKKGPLTPAQVRELLALVTPEAVESFIRGTPSGQQVYALHLSGGKSNGVRTVSPISSIVHCPNIFAGEKPRLLELVYASDLTEATKYFEMKIPHGTRLPKGM